MKPCDLHTGSARIRHYMEELLRVWEESSEEWNDAASETFYRERLEPILPIVKNSLDAIGRMQSVLSNAQRDLEK